MEGWLAVALKRAVVRPEPTVPALSEQQTKAGIYRGTIRLLSGGVPDPPDELEVRLLTALEVVLLARRAELDGLPHASRLLERCCCVPPVVKIALERMVSKITAAAPPPPPLPPVPVKQARR